MNQTAPEMVEQSAPVASQTKAPLNFQVVEENLDKWNFQDDTKALFVGQYVRTDNFHDKVQQKDFSLYVFEEWETGKRYHIDSSHTIAKTVEGEKAEGTDFSKVVFMIQFLGKTMLKGKPFNQFTISKAIL